MSANGIIALALTGAAVGFIRHAYRAWDRVPSWRRWLYALLASVLVVSAAEWGAAAITGRAALDTTLGRTLALVWALSWSFVLLLGLIRGALAMPWAPLAVARTVLREAMATRIVPGVIGALFVGIVLVPLTLDTDRPLLYRMQQHLAFGFMWTGLLLSLMTVFLSCWTLSREIEQKQVYTTLVKPVGRGQFLLGKWIGLVLLNALLVTVAGVTVWAMTVFYLAEQKPTDAADALAVRERVLTARVSSTPVPPQALYDRVDQQLAAQRDEQGSDFIASRGGVDKARAEMLAQAVAAWKALAPGGQTGAAQTYVFENLQPVRDFARRKFDEAVEAKLADLLARYPDADPQRARQRAEHEADAEGYSGQFVHLEYKVRASGQHDGKVRLGWLINGQAITTRAGEEVPVAIRQTKELPSYLIDPETGKLEVTIVNVTPAVALTFPGDDGLLLLHKVDTFGPNLLRAWLIVGLKLTFLAAIGLALATYLQFPVAVLASLLVLGAASSADYILEATRYYGKAHLGQASVLQNTIRFVAESFTWPFKMYAEFKPGDNVVDGTFISWAQVGQCALWVAALWCAVAGLYGWWQLSRRELARVQV